MKKRILSLLLVFVTIVVCVPVLSQKAEAACSFNREAAIDYAKAHWNDGVGQCAEFVSRCMIAGGMDMGVEITADGAACAILKAIGKPVAWSENYDPYEGVCTKAVLSNGYLTKTKNDNLLKEGDVVFYYCETDHKSPHIMLFGGWNNKGFATFYCHNDANRPENQQNYEIYTFTSSSSVMVNNRHKSGCECAAYIIHFEDCHYNSSGFCGDCGNYSLEHDTTVTGNKEYRDAKVYSLNCACRVRKGPYQEYDSPDGNKTPKGTQFTIVGELINGKGHLWYKTADGRYIYGEYADYVGPSTAVSFGDVTVSGITESNAVLKTTVNKKSGADAQKYGVKIMEIEHNGVKVNSKTKKPEFPDTAVSNSRTSYSFSMDLVKEAGITLRSNSTYVAYLTVVVDGARYSSKDVIFKTSGGGSAAKFLSDPILDADTVKQLESADPGFSSGSSGAITWNTASVTNVTSTGALVKYTLTPNKSLISRIGLQYCTDGSSYVKVPGCEWAGSTLTSFCSVAFNGSEGPKLNPGTNYYCRFYITCKDGSTEYSPVITFTTAAGSSAAITWNTPSVTNLTETAALVKYTLTPNKSLIKRIGMQYCTDGSSFSNVPGCEWAGSTLTNFCSVAFDGSEGPRLNPGTKYYCRFYITKTDGNTEYSPVITFSTNGTAIREYTVSLNVNRDDGTITESSQITVRSGSSFGYLPKPFSACAMFSGWYTKPDGGQQVTEYTTVTNDCPAVLYAHWQPYSYTVHFDPAGGSVSMGSKAVTNDQPFGALPVPIRAGYEFLGWFYNDFTPLAVQPEWIVSAWQDFTLTARWAKLGESSAEGSNAIMLWIDNPYISVNGNIAVIDSNGTVPVIRNDRTLLPIRCIIEAMGGSVGWDGSLRMVTLRIGDKELNMIIDYNGVVDQSGKTYYMDTAPIIINDRTMLPVRFVAEFFGATVEWDGKAKAVTITY